MKRFSVLLLLLIIGCVKREYIIQQPTEAPVTLERKVKDVLADTTVNGVWDGGWKVLRINDKRIHGKGTLTHWIIDAAYTQWIFDTSINLVDVQVYSDRFSTAWYGTLSINADNWWNLQKSINVCKDRFPCYTPGAGTYRYSKTLEVSSVVANAYKYTSIRFFGDASYWNNGQGTTFQYTGLGGPAINLQLNKGSELDHFVLKGSWRSPTGTDLYYFNLLEAYYKDQSGYNLPDTFKGVAIDNNKPLDGITRSGSSGNYIHDLGLEGFGMGIAMSQNGVTQNNDASTIDHIYFRDNLKYCFVNGQAQEKGNVVNYIYSWGSVYNVINMGWYGSRQAGDYTFDYANIAGRCIQPFNMSISQWFSSTIDHWYVENIRDIGKFSAQMPLNIYNSTFELCLTIPKDRIIIYSNSPFVSFNHCTIRYYDGIGGDIAVHGIATFDSLCSFYGGKIIYK